jgi:hypothetical protein
VYQFDIAMSSAIQANEVLVDAHPDHQIIAELPVAAGGRRCRVDQPP